MSWNLDLHILYSKGLIAVVSDRELQIEWEKCALKLELILGIQYLVLLWYGMGPQIDQLMLNAFKTALSSKI